jgi:hypothetical protein
MKTENTSPKEMGAQLENYARTNFNVLVIKGLPKNDIDFLPPSLNNYKEYAGKYSFQFTSQYSALCLQNNKFTDGIRTVRLFNKLKIPCFLSKLEKR